MPDNTGGYIATIERLQGMVKEGWIIRMQEVDKKTIVSATHFLYSKRAGVGNSIQEAVLELENDKEM